MTPLQPGMKLTRNDGKEFTVVDISYWSKVKGTDGEIDFVVGYGVDKFWRGFYHGREYEAK